MDKPEPWIAECRVRTGAESQEYSCKAAVWADSQESLRSRLIAHLSNEDIHLLEVVQALPVFAYFRAQGPDPKLAELSQKVHSGMLAVRGSLVANAPLPVAAGADKSAETLEEALLQLDPEDGPVFAVLDGAQFDDLPKALFDGDFVHRPLYKDNAIGNEDRAKTAPQMVWLDEREERASGRTHKETIPALLELVAGRPAAVFWQCPAGAEALYKHLRRINMVMIPKDALPDEIRNQGSGVGAASQETHAIVLFRHADANVMAQVIGGLNHYELARTMGPAKKLLFAQQEYWGRIPYSCVVRADNLPLVKSGFFSLTTETMHRIEQIRENGLRKWAVAYFTNREIEGFDASFQSQIERAFDRGRQYGLEQQEDIWSFISLDLNIGENFEQKEGMEDIFYILKSDEKSPKEKIYYVNEIYSENIGGE